MSILQDLKHSAEWHAERRKGIGGSDATAIMRGDGIELWEEKLGLREPEDLSDILAVQMGSYTEPLNREWFAKQTGIQVYDCLESRVHRDRPYMRANLDGICTPNEIDTYVFEAKHVGAFRKPDEVVRSYYWQCQHYIEVVGADGVYLSVFFGNSKWEYFAIERNDADIEDLVAREKDFWAHVVSKTPPGDQVPVTVNIALDDMIEADFTGDNEWANMAADWIKTIQPRKQNEKVAKELKSKVEPNVKRAHGHGIEIKRSKAGALTIRET